MKSGRFIAKVTAAPPTRAFTLVELLVVMVIIVVLISAVMVASTTLIAKSRTSNTQALLAIVRDSVEQFAREQKANPTLTRKKAYTDRYDYFPPDELEVFTPDGVPFALPPTGSLAVGRAEIVPEPEYDNMKFYTRGLPPDEAALEHRDLAAMIVAIETLGDASTAILDGIPERNRVAGPIDATSGNPKLFLDRPPNGWDSGDFEVRYIVDDWGTPIRYFAQRDGDPSDPAATVSSNHDDWNEVSTKLIRLNGGQPVIMSYGPNGKDQLTQDAMGTTADVSLVVDFMANGKVDEPFNADNVYADQSLKDKLAEGI